VPTLAIPTDTQRAAFELLALDVSNARTCEEAPCEYWRLERWVLRWSATLWFWLSWCWVPSAIGVERQARDSQVVGTAQWPPLVDEDTWRAVTALVTDTSRRAQTTTESQWLGSSVYRCGKHAGKVRGGGIGQTPSKPHTSRRHCTAGATTGTCRSWSCTQTTTCAVWGPT
jgi:hypothetical protein